MLAIVWIGYTTVMCNSKAVLSTISTSHRAVVVSASNIISDLWKAKHNTNTARTDPINMLPYYHTFSLPSWEHVLNTWDVLCARSILQVL